MSFANSFFDLRDLGLFDQPASRALKHLTLQSGNCGCTGLGALSFHDSASQSLSVLFTPIDTAGNVEYEQILYTGSLTSQVIHRNDLLIGAICPTTNPVPDASLVRTRGSYIAAPVHDPAEAPVGCVISVGDSERVWSREEMQRVREVAFLVSQHILFKASLATIKILSDRIEDQKNPRILN